MKIGLSSPILFKSRSIYFGQDKSTTGMVTYGFNFMPETPKSTLEEKVEHIDELKKLTGATDIDWSVGVSIQPA